MDKFGLKEEAPARMFFIRHGEVEASRQNRYNGYSDVKLSPRGVRQLEEVAERLAKEPIRAVYASDLFRSQRGAEAVAKRFGLTIQTYRELREMNFGEWEGLTPEEVSERFPEEWEAWLVSPVDCRPSRGETYREAYRRVLGVIEALVEKHRGESIAIVAHGGVNRLVLASALKSDLGCLFRLEQKFAALNIIDFYKTAAVVKLVNG